MMQLIRVSIAVLAAGALACGGGESDSASLVTPMKADAETSSSPNRSPVIRSVHLEPTAPVAGDRVNAVVIVEDPDGDAVELGYVWRVSGHQIPAGGSSIELKAVSKNDRIEVAVTASDGRLNSDTAHANTRVPNRRPVLLGVGLRPSGEVISGDTLVAMVQARDPDRDPIGFRYRWQVNGKEISNERDRLETDELAKGDEIRVFAAADDGSAMSDELGSAIVRVGNSHPEIVSAPEVRWTDGEFRYEIEAKDPDGDRPLRYELRSGPDGMLVDSVLGAVSWKPKSNQTGVFPIEVAVSDPMGATTVQHFEITVKWTEEEPPPVPANNSR
jgi:hypothetical protein